MGRFRGATGNLLTHTISSAAGTGGAILGYSAIAPAPPKQQDFNHANMLAPKIQDMRAFINGNFDGSTTFIMVAIIGSLVVMGVMCLCNKCYKWVPTVGARRKELQQTQAPPQQGQDMQYQDNIKFNNPWTAMENGHYLPRAVK